MLQRGLGAVEPPDEVVERLVTRGADMGMKPEQEERQRAVALAKTEETVAANGLSAGGGARLRDILDRHLNAFWRGLRGDPPTRVESLTVSLNRGISGQGAKTCILTDQDRVAGDMHWNLGRVQASVSQSAGCVGQCGDSCAQEEIISLVNDYHAVNKQIEKVPDNMLNQEGEMADLGGLHFLGRLKCSKDFGGCRWRPNPRKCSPSPMCVPKGVFNATAIQGVTTECWPA